MPNCRPRMSHLETIQEKSSMKIEVLPNVEVQVEATKTIECILSNESGSDVQRVV